MSGRGSLTYCLRSHYAECLLLEFHIIIYIIYDIIGLLLLMYYALTQHFNIVSGS